MRALRLQLPTVILCLYIRVLSACPSLYACIADEFGGASSKGAGIAGAAGAGGLALLVERGCARSASRAGSELIAGTTERAGALEAQSIVKAYEMRTLEPELAPGVRLSNPALPLTEAYTLGQVSTRSAVSSAVDREVVLYDATGQLLPQHTGERLLVREAYQARAHQLLDEVIQSIPAEKLTDERQLRLALEGALKKQPRGEYSFNGTTGKVEFTIKTGRGKVVAEFNVYKVVKVAATAAGTYGLYRKLNGFPAAIVPDSMSR